MSPSDFPIRDQQDVPIWNAIEVKNYKQAIKVIDKRIKKKSSEYLEALRIYVQSRDFSPETEKGNVLIYIEKLRDRTPAVTDYDALELLDEAFNAVLPNSPDDWARFIGELRLQRVLAKPKEDEVSKQCFRVCIYRGDLDHAEKISNALQKAFPDKHIYHFWSIATKFLYSLNTKYDKEDRIRWGRLAFAFISKMATDTQKAGAEKKPLPVRSIHTPQEVLLLHLITEKYGSTEKRLQYLDDPYLGAESTVAKGEWQLWRWKIQLMTSTRQWKALFDTTSSLLVRARTKDSSGKIAEARYSDWIVWEGLIRSVKELSQDDISTEEIDILNKTVHAELKAHTDSSSGIDKSWRRNSSLAELKFKSESISPFSETPEYENNSGEIDTTKGVLSDILEYLHRYGDATTAYIDLRPTIETLNQRQRSQLLAKITESRQKFKLNKATDITKLVNSYKLSYLLISAIPEHEISSVPGYKADQNSTCDKCSQKYQSFCSSCLTQLAKSMTESYKKIIKDNKDVAKELLPTDRHPADDLCLLLAMCLIKSAVASKPSEWIRPGVPQILVAAMLLEYAWTHSKSNFQITLLLVKLYSYIGCGSLAMRAYQRLKSKQIQLDTLSFTVLNRISSLHPHSFSHHPEDSASPLTEPIEHLIDQQKYYAIGSKQMTKNIYGSFQEGSYNSIFQITEALETLNRSVASISSVIESGRILRLLLPNRPLTAKLCGHNILIPSAELYETMISDTNDYNVFPNFESTKSPRFISLFDFLVPETSKFQTHANLLSEKLVLILSLDHVPFVGEVKTIVRGFEQLPKEHEGGFKNMTFSERLTVQCSEVMTYIIYESLENQPPSDTAKDIYCERICEKLKLMNDAITGITEAPPTCQPDLQLLYMGYDLGTVVLKFLKFMSDKKPKAGSTSLKEVWAASTLQEEMFTGASGLIQIVIKKSTSIKKRLDEGGLIDWVVDSLSGNADSTEFQSLSDTISTLIDDNFREIWAGEVVESWKDSVEGFSYFKPPPTEI